MDGVWTRQCEPSSEAARQSRERQQSGAGSEGDKLGPIHRAWFPRQLSRQMDLGSSLPGQEGVHTNGNAGALEGRDRLEDPREPGC